MITITIHHVPREKLKAMAPGLDLYNRRTHANGEYYDAGHLVVGHNDITFFTDNYTEVQHEDGIPSVRKSGESG